jgi:hypothetical protein
MQQADTTLLVLEASTIFSRIVHFFGSLRILVSQPDQSPRPDRILSNIDWPDSGSEQPSHDSRNQPVCGGYNEAFIVQHWASYQPR